MKSQTVWLLLVSLLLMCGMIGCGDKQEREPVAKKSEPQIEDGKVVASEAQKKCGQRLGQPVEITNSIGMKLKLIPAGEFMMGSQEVGPQHKVRITKPFYLGVYEVTQAEYEEVMGKNPSWFSKGGGGAEEVPGEDTSGYPVEQVSWEDAVEFCKKLSAKEGKTYRLPTEAEWEYACRAGTTTRFSFGNDGESLAGYAWYSDNSDVKTHSVGEKKPNAWRLHDMHGNVWEWCADWHGLYAIWSAQFKARLTARTAMFCVVGFQL